MIKTKIDQDTAVDFRKRIGEGPKFGHIYWKGLKFAASYDDALKWIEEQVKISNDGAFLGKLDGYVKRIISYRSYQLNQHESKYNDLNPKKQNVAGVEMQNKIEKHKRVLQKWEAIQQLIQLQKTIINQPKKLQLQAVVESTKRLQDVEWGKHNALELYYDSFNIPHNTKTSIQELQKALQKEIETIQSWVLELRGYVGRHGSSPALKDAAETCLSSVEEVEKLMQEGQKIARELELLTDATSVIPDEVAKAADKRRGTTESTGIEIPKKAKPQNDEEQKQEDLAVTEGVKQDTDIRAPGAATVERTRVSDTIKQSQEIEKKNPAYRKVKKKQPRGNDGQKKDDQAMEKLNLTNKINKLFEQLDAVNKKVLDAFIVEEISKKGVSPDVIQQLTNNTETAEENLAKQISRETDLRNKILPAFRAFYSKVSSIGTVYPNGYHSTSNSEE